jgi:hypothetical protein
VQTIVKKFSCAHTVKYGTYEAIKKGKHMMNFKAFTHVSRILFGALLLSAMMARCLWLPPLTLEDPQFKMQQKAAIPVPPSPVSAAPVSAQLPSSSVKTTADRSADRSEGRPAVMPPLVVADAGLGKTHFIIGTEQIAPTKKGAEPQPSVATPVLFDGLPLNCDGHVCTVLFENFYDTLQLLIEREKKRISIAAYMLTDKRIVQWLQEAQERGVKIEVVTDMSCLRERANKLGDLYEGGISVFICMPERKGAKSSLMHNKFVLFESNIYGRHIVWTGSANLTRSAFGEIHHENIVVLDDPELYKEYERQFAQLKKRSERYEDCTITNAALHEKIRISQNEQRKSSVMNGKNRRVA